MRRLPPNRERFFWQEVRAVCKESRVLQGRAFCQHGDTSVYQHSLHVTYESCLFAERYHLPVDYSALIRGALLHDYFLYDWHKSDELNPHRLHGFFHPSRSLQNAQKEYNLTARQRDIIIKHMWPLTVIPPMCREAWIVTSADKFCSLMETLYIHRGRIHNGKKKKYAAAAAVSNHRIA